MKLHALRGAVSGAMATSFFTGLVYLPMAEGIALSFIAPLIALYLAAVMLGETIGGRAILASLLGLAGVAVIAAARLSAQTLGGNAAWCELAGGDAAALLGEEVAHALACARRGRAQGRPGRRVVVQRGIVQALLGATSCGMLFLAARHFVSHRVGVVAGVILAVCAQASVALSSVTDQIGKLLAVPVESAWIDTVNIRYPHENVEKFLI